MAIAARSTLTGDRSRRRVAVPVVFWAAVGAVSVVYIVIALSLWAAGGIHAVDPGVDTMPTAKRVLMHVVEWGQVGVFVALLWLVVIRPLVRRQRLGFDGLFLLAAVLLNFWDPLDNYARFAFQYNAFHLNVGSWGGYIPGWQSPHPELWVVPIAWVLSAYAWGFFLAAKAGCAVIERLEKRYPNWGWVRQYAVVFLTNAVIAAASELVFLQIGAIVNILPYQGLTLWDSGLGAWPVYNPFLFSATWTVLTALRRSSRFDGLSFVERGVEGLTASPKAQSAIRFLAIFAFMEVAYIGLYFLPFNLFAMMRSIPAVPLPSYFPTP
jgi:hypothetical protein